MTDTLGVESCLLEESMTSTYFKLDFPENEIAVEFYSTFLDILARRITFYSVLVPVCGRDLPE